MLVFCFQHTSHYCLCGKSRSCSGPYTCYESALLFVCNDTDTHVVTMSLNNTLSTMTRPLSLVLEDKALLPEPLLAVALYDFEGEPEMAELTFSKGQMLVSSFSYGLLYNLSDGCSRWCSARTSEPAGVWQCS